MFTFATKKSAVRVRSPSPLRPLELLAIQQFDSLLEAQVLVADWHDEYNTHRPQGALGMLTPAALAARWRSRTPTNSHNGGLTTWVGSGRRCRS